MKIRGPERTPLNQKSSKANRLKDVCLSPYALYPYGGDK
jgi:hypothetical protein